MNGLRRVMAVVLAVATPISAWSAPVADRSLVLLQQRDAQLFAVGWRLARGNAAFCEGAAPALGFALLDAGAYGDPDGVRRQLGLSGDIAVSAVAPQSAAADAGVSVNDTILAIDGQAIAQRFPRARPSWQRLIDVVAAIDAAARLGPVTLDLMRADGTARSVTLAGQPACPSRFEVLDSGGKAMAEGTRVIFGRDFVGFGYPADEFAAAVAHEFAHNLLGHRKLLAAKGRSLGNVRLTEREADRLMPWLLANAGYDPAAALRFMERWGPRHDGGPFRNRNHEGWDERAEAIRAELARVEVLAASEGKADWARHFERETLLSK